MFVTYIIQKLRMVGRGDFSRYTLYTISTINKKTIIHTKKRYTRTQKHFHCWNKDHVEFSGYLLQYVALIMKQFASKNSLVKNSTTVI